MGHGRHVDDAGTGGLLVKVERGGGGGEEVVVGVGVEVEVEVGVEIGGIVKYCPG